LKNLFILLVFVSAAGFSQPGMQYDVLIRNGKIIDGTGNSWYYGDLAIKNGIIVKTGKLDSVTATRTIDATGLIVAPGFIDVHTHIEGDELRNPTADNFIYDGVTTVVTGNCGASRVNIGEYLKLIDSVRTSINVATLIGHNDVRRSVMGNANRDPNENELAQMEMLVEKGMQQGAVGLSTGLIYIPGTYSNTNEIVRLAKAAAKYHGVYASHMRNEGDSVVQAIEEALYIGKAAAMPVEISQF
jgi:N-acyl-D-amino-acid deacylase